MFISKQEPSHVQSHSLVLDRKPQGVDLHRVHQCCNGSRESVQTVWQTIQLQNHFLHTNVTKINTIAVYVNIESCYYKLPTRRSKCMNISFDDLPENVKYLLRCAFADLEGSMQAHEQGDSANHDWKAHEETIKELKQYILG